MKLHKKLQRKLQPLLLHRQRTEQQLSLLQTRLHRQSLQKSRSRLRQVRAVRHRTSQLRPQI